MWDTVAWNYRLRRKLPEFSHKKVNVVVRDGLVLLNDGERVIEISDGEEIIKGTRVIVSHRDHVVFFIVGRAVRRKIVSYIAGVSCHNQLVTTQMIQAAVDWVRKKVALKTPPEDELDLNVAATHNLVDAGATFERAQRPVITRGDPIEEPHYTVASPYANTEAVIPTPPQESPNVVWRGE